MKNNNIHCLNCRHQLLGDFCHNCGQENINTKITFSELARDYLGDMFTYDSRLYRTVTPLLIKPGFLTKEYFVGKRAPYVPPLRLYLFISFILFLWLALVDTNMINIGNPERAASEFSEQQGAITNDSDTPEWAKSFGERLEQNYTVIAQNPGAFADILASRLPYLMFLLLPIFALILWLHFAFSGYNYLQHFVFTLHFHAFAYLLNLIFSVSNQIISWEFGYIALLLINVYLGMAMKVAYGSSIIGCIFKTISILTIYILALATGIIAFLLINIFNFT